MVASPPISQRRKTAMAVLKCFQDWTMESIMSLRTEDCIQEVLPASLQQPPLNNTQYRAFLSPVLPNLRGFKITPKSVMEDTEQNKIIIHCSSVADVVVGGKVAVKAGYKNEYIIIFWFNKDGKKITRMVEFVDGLGIGKKMGVMLGTVKGKL